MTKETAKSPTLVTTGKVRASFVNVFEPRMNELSGKEEYSMMLILPKSDKATVSAINAAAKAAAMAKFQGKIPKNARHPLRDGDDLDSLPDSLDPDVVEGCYFFNVKSTRYQPGVVDQKLQPVIDEKDFMSGDYCHVSLNAYAYSQKGNQGVSLGLRNVQVVAKGEPLGGSVSRPENDFQVIATDDDDDDMDAAFG